MHIDRFCIALLPVLGLLAGACHPVPPEQDPGAPELQGLVQPFLITMDRHEHHVIVFIADHPDYQAIEAMVTLRPGRPPLIRATINLHDGHQIDHFNDHEIASDRAAIFTGRETVYRPITFETDDVNGVPVTRVRFTSYRGEVVKLRFEALTPPAPQLGGFIDPGAHAAGSSLPVMWADASALDGDGTVLLIDGVPFTLVESPPSPFPGGFYTAGFRIGVLRQGQLELRPLATPSRLAEGEWWVYEDNLGHLHLYEILDTAGDRLTIRVATTSPVFTTQVLEAEVVDESIELRSIRVTGQPLGWAPIPPPPAGLMLDLSVPGQFSISLDGHEDLVTGTASSGGDDTTRSWTLVPTAPSWATNRSAQAVVTRQPDGYTIVNEVGAP